jgi:glutamyl-tRNA reductase
MNLLSIGISHSTAPLDVREKMWLSLDEIRQALQVLKKQYFSECMVMSTCNRTEVYGVTPAHQIDDGELRQFMIDFKGASGTVKADHFFGNFSGGAVQHLFKVAAGIDSMVIGDVQILGQVKEAFALSQEMNVSGPVINRLMQSTLHVGKRTRTETSISEGAVSISFAAVELASKIFEDLSRKSALLIGAGDTGELAVKHLAGKGMGDLRIANRTRSKAEELVAKLGGTVVAYEDLVDALRTVDIVITSVNSPSYVVRPEDVQKVMKERSHNPLFIIDIGVPRNVNPAAKRIDNVFLYDIDSLSSIVDKNIEKRKGEIAKVTRIIREEMIEFFHWHNSLRVGPMIHDLRDVMENIRRQEVEKNINRFRPEDRDLVDLVTRRIVNKILHQPVTALKQGAENGESSRETAARLDALRELFGIRRDGHGREQKSNES